MAEYITKDAVISLFEKWSDGYAYIEIPVQDAIRQVSAIPTANVRPANEISDAVDEGIRILNAINTSGRLDYRDYYELYDLILQHIDTR